MRAGFFEAASEPYAWYEDKDFLSCPLNKRHIDDYGGHGPGRQLWLGWNISNYSSTNALIHLCGAHTSKGANISRICTRIIIHMFNPSWPVHSHHSGDRHQRSRDNHWYMLRGTLAARLSLSVGKDIFLRGKIRNDLQTQSWSSKSNYDLMMAQLTEATVL